MSTMTGSLAFLNKQELTFLCVCVRLLHFNDWAVWQSVRTTGVEG